MHKNATVLFVHEISTILTLSSNPDSHCHLLCNMNFDSIFCCSRFIRLNICLPSFHTYFFTHLRAEDKLNLQKKLHFQVWCLYCPEDCVSQIHHYLLLLHSFTLIQKQSNYWPQHTCFPVNIATFLITPNLKVICKLLLVFKACSGMAAQTSFVIPGRTWI